MIDNERVSDQAVTLHARGCVDGVAEQAILRHFLADHTGHHTARVNTYHRPTVLR